MKRHELMKSLIRTVAIGTLLYPLLAAAQPGGMMMGDDMGMMGGPGQGMGMGSGMMMGGGCGMGIMGTQGVYMLNLTDDQRGKINAIQDKLRKQHWEVMGKMMDEHNALRDLYSADMLDGKAIGATYDRLFKLKRQMIDAGIKARNDTMAVLTKEQREQLKQFRHGRGMYGYGMGMGGRGPMGQGRTMGPGMMGQ